jgi:glycosyltransferase involved in cell wall biosynthesis
VRIRVSAVIPAFNEAARVGDTVRAVRSLPEVTEVIVVDDGSTDNTAAVAADAGARVIRLPRNQGKGEALRRGLRESAGEIVLLLDADLGASAAEAALLLTPVLAGQADLAIAELPAAPGTGGFGLVRKLARFGLRRLAKFTARAPLSGQRAIRRELLERIGIASGFGVEVAMTIRAARLGARVVEVPTKMTHAFTGRNLAGFLHRGRQFRDLAIILLRIAISDAQHCWLAAWIPFAALAVAMLVRYSAITWMTVAELARPVAWTGLTTLVLLILALTAGRRWPIQAINYQKRSIPSALGLALAAGALGAGIAGWPLMRLLPAPLLGAWAVVAIMGAIDDGWGGRAGGGFRGHLRALGRGQFTTGLAKVVIIGAASLVLGFYAAGVISSLGMQWTPSAGWIGVLNGVVIALCANAMNLLDLRPGRALKVFMLGALAVTLAIGNWDWPLIPLIAVVGPVLVYAPFDLRARGMMGDAGSNFLGAALGLASVFALGLPGKLVLLGLLVAFHAYCERASLSAFIRRCPPLRWLDELGRAPESPGAGA